MIISSKCQVDLKSKFLDIDKDLLKACWKYLKKYYDIKIVLSWTVNCQWRTIDKLFPWSLTKACKNLFNVILIISASLLDS